MQATVKYPGTEQDTQMYVDQETEMDATARHQGELGAEETEIAELLPDQDRYEMG